MVDFLLFGAAGVPGSLINDIGTPTIAEITHPFWIFDWSAIYHQEVAICCVILFFSAVLCSAAGIGGGGIYVAVLMVSGRLTPHNAVPLSKAIVFFGAIASLVVNLAYSTKWRGNPGGGKSVIDLDACRLVIPATLIGTFAGVLLNRHTSDYCIVVLLTLLLVMMTCMVARTARQQAMEERAQDERASALAEPGAADTTADAYQDGSSGGTNTSSSNDEVHAASSGAASGEVQQTNENTPLLAPPNQAVAASVVDDYVVVPCSRKQNPSVRDGITGGALLFIVIVGGIMRFHMRACRAELLGDITMTGACQHPVNLLFRHHMEVWMKEPVTAVVMEQLVWSIPIWTCIAATVQFGFVANRDFGWTPKSIVLYQVVAIMTGLLAGLVGVGGGLILSPFFLLTGMDPAIAVGTSATCVLFTSSSTTMQYIFTDRIIMSLALVYGIVTAIASFTGTCLVHYIQDKFARKSYITTIVAVGVAISAMLSVVKFVYLVANPTPDAASSHAFIQGIF